MMVCMLSTGAAGNAQAASGVVAATAAAAAAAEAAAMLGAAPIKPAHSDLESIDVARRRQARTHRVLLCC